jgi:EmrB/QacA subfamily drug resistance transporter
MSAKKLVLIAISIFLSIVFIDETGVAVTLPQIQHQFAMSNSALQWVMNGFFLPLSVLVLFGGKISDHLGCKKVFNIGMGIFIIASLLCGFSQSGTMIIVARILQGIGGSLLLATYAVLIGAVFPGNERGVALGTCAAVASVFLATGPFIGGFLAHYLSWRVIFYINLPLGLLCLYFIDKAIPKDSQFDTQDDFDFVGLGLFLVGFTALVFALMQALDYGWTSNIIISLLVASVILLPLFVWHQLKNRNPLADLRLFKIGNFTSANIILLCTQVVVMSITYWAIWLQTSLNFSPLLAGIALLPAGLPILVTARIGGQWLDKYGPRLPIGLGSVIVLFGMVWLAAVASQQNYWWSFWGFLAYGIGAPLIISPCIATVMGSVAPEKRGMASGMLNTMRQLGAALCFAIVGVVINNFYAAGHSTSANTQALYTHAFSYGMVASALFALVACIFALFLLKNHSEATA